MTTETVPQSIDEREARTIAWHAVRRLMDMGLPLPCDMSIGDAGNITLSFHDLADARVWALATEAFLHEERREASRGGAISYYGGTLDGLALYIFAHEARDLIGVPLVEDAVERVEAYMADQAPTPPGSRKPALRPRDILGFNQLYADGDPTAEAGETEGPALGGAL